MNEDHIYRLGCAMNEHLFARVIEITNSTREDGMLDQSNVKNHGIRCQICGLTEAQSTKFGGPWKTLKEAQAARDELLLELRPSTRSPPREP